MRIGFLFNHDQIHQVAHSLPIALALARENIDAEIVLAVTNPALASEVRRLGGAELVASSIVIRELALSSRVHRWVADKTASFAPLAKLLVYGDNLDFFRSLDLLVVAEKTSLILKTRYGLDRLKIVHTRHGAGDRAIGFDKASAGFDLVLVSGEKIKDRLIADAGVLPEKIRIVGYPKFDISPSSPPPFPDRDDDRPIVLYNPHVSPHLSSWYRMGREILDWFVRHDEYRLIFAPHVMLFHRRFVLTIDKLRIDRPGRIEEHVRQAPNIHIDLGSPASTDMTYTRAADIYLGDASSQVYEFLQTPRPCVFVDAHGFDWRGNPNFTHWSTGPVIRDVCELAEGLAHARQKHATRFGPIQQRLLARTFDFMPESSSRRAAVAIKQFAGLPAASSVSTSLVSPSPERLPDRPPVEIGSSFSIA